MCVRVCVKENEQGCFEISRNLISFRIDHKIFFLTRFTTKRVDRQKTSLFNLFQVLYRTGSQPSLNECYFFAIYKNLPAVNFGF